MSSAKLPEGGIATHDPETALTLAAFLPYRLSVVAALVSDGLASRYGERFGIAIPEWRVLATIGEFRSVTAKAIGLHARMGKVKVSRAAASLEARGLISRLPNVEDLRESFLVLTEEGKDVYAQIVPLALDYGASLTDGFTQAERETLDRLLDRLRARAEAMGGNRG